MMPHTMSAFCYGGELNLVKQTEVTLPRAGYSVDHSRALTCYLTLDLVTAKNIDGFS